MNRKGPMGEGPRTGRGLGRCNLQPQNGNDDQGVAPDTIDDLPRGMGRGMGRGPGRGPGRGMGRGFGRGMGRGLGRGGGGRGR